MNIEIVHFIFFIHYLYLILLLFRQNWNLYKRYCLELMLAATISMASIVFEMDSPLLTGLASVIFIAIFIAPLALSSLISKSFARKDLRKTTLYANIRYRLTGAVFHRLEYRIFLCWRKVLAKRYEEAWNDLVSLKFSEIFSRYHKASSDYSFMLNHLEAAVLFCLSEPGKSIPEEMLPFPDKIDEETEARSDPMKRFHHGPCWITISLIITNSLFFLWSGLTGDDLLALINYGANSFEFAFYEGQYWRLFSSLFLHAGFIHLLLNLIGLHTFGSFLEDVYGRVNFTIIYLLSGFLGSCIGFCVRPYSMIPSLGASGAICGLVGTNAWFFFFRGEIFSNEIRKHYTFSFIFIIVSMAIMGYLIPQIDNSAHFGGLITGFLLGFCLKTKEDSSQYLNIFSILKFGTFSLLLFGMLLSFGFQIHNALYNAYPSRPCKLSWYHIAFSPERSANPILVGLPFPWRMDEFLRKQDVKFYLYPRENPQKMEVSKALFWDCYNISPQNFCYMSFQIEPFPIRKDKDIIRNVQEILEVRTEKKVALAAMEERIYGGKNYFYFRHDLDIPENLKQKDYPKEGITAEYYYLAGKDCLYELRFQYPKKYENRYLKIFESVLSVVRGLDH